MATLLENATRIGNAVPGLKNQIISMGGSPTGGIETFENALKGITIPKVKTGTFTSNTNGNTVDCGFKPKYICVTCGDSKGLVASVDTSVYVNGASHPYVSYYRTTANAIVQETDANASARFPSISSSGFTYKSRFNGNTCTYFAIG